VNPAQQGEAGDRLPYRKRPATVAKAAAAAKKVDETAWRSFFCRCWHLLAGTGLWHRHHGQECGRTSRKCKHDADP